MRKKNKPLNKQSDKKLENLLIDLNDTDKFVNSQDKPDNLTEQEFNDNRAWKLATADQFRQTIKEILQKRKEEKIRIKNGNRK